MTELAAVPEVWRTEFIALRDVPSRQLCGVQGFMFTCGLLTNLRFDGLTYDYDARYCFPSRTEAVRALREWDGAGDPPGEWVKEKVSGRQRVPRPWDVP